MNYCFKKAEGKNLKTSGYLKFTVHHDFKYCPILLRILSVQIRPAILVFCMFRLLLGLVFINVVFTDL